MKTIAISVMSVLNNQIFTILRRNRRVNSNNRRDHNMEKVSSIALLNDFS